MGGRLQGKVALITGGGSGIGAATARRFVASGARVVITGRRRGIIEPLAREIGCLAVAGDVGDESHCRDAVAAAVGKYGGLDILVANAGIEHFGSAAEVEMAQWHEVMRTNVDGVLLAARAAIEPMRQRGGGAMVVVGSVASLFGAPHGASYVTSKSALLGLTRSLACDYGVDGIRVNAICPGWVRTEMAERAFKVLADAKQIDLDEVIRRLTRHYPLRRMADPAEIAGSIEFLVSQDASFVTGAILNADGGGSIVDVGTLEFSN